MQQENILVHRIILLSRVSVIEQVAIGTRKREDKGDSA